MTAHMTGGPGNSYEEHWYRVMKERALESDAAEEADAARELEVTETTAALLLDEVEVEIGGDASVDREGAELVG